MYYYKFSPKSDSEIILKIGKYLMKPRRTKIAPFLGHPVAFVFFKFCLLEKLTICQLL